ncbi:hypothetical protein QUB64_19415 [Microcoleus sp. Aus8_D2]
MSSIKIISCLAIGMKLYERSHQAYFLMGQLLSLAHCLLFGIEG